MLCSEYFSRELTHLVRVGNFVRWFLQEVFFMINFRIISPCLLITICCVAVAQPKYRITNIMGRTSISVDEANRIKNYASGWARALQTTDTAELFNAHRHLIEPLELDVKISRYGRSLYGMALEDVFHSILSSFQSLLGIRPGSCRRSFAFWSRRPCCFG